MIDKYALIALIFALFTAILPRETAAAPAELLSPSNGPNQSSPVQQTTQPSQPEGLTGPNDTFWKRDTLTGDWGDFRNQLLYKGFTFTPLYEGEVFGNWGGAKQGAIADGFFNLALDIDLNRVTGFWKDAIIHANALSIYGPGLSQKYVGDFSNTSNLAGYNSLRLQEAWLQQSFWLKRFSLKVGLIAVDTEFFSSEASGLFINGTFGAFTLLASNFTNAPVYPLASPGIRLDVAPVSMLDFKASVLGMSADSDPTQNNRHGTYFDFDNGALFAFEASYLVNQSPNDRGRIGSYRLGGFIQHGDYTTFQSQAADALGTGSISKNGTNWAAYGVVDQEIYKHGDKVIALFGRGGFAPSRYSFVTGYFDTGLTFTGFLPGRIFDVAGIAVARSSISGDFSESQQSQGEPPSSAETVVEATYKVQVAPWWTVQPDFQYIINPSGVQGSRNADVLGVRTTIAF